MKKPYYLTTAIAYTSRKPHIGNSYEIVMTDALARFRRMQGYDVYFLTGTDEHGQYCSRRNSDRHRRHLRRESRQRQKERIINPHKQNRSVTRTTSARVTGRLFVRFFAST